MKRHRKGFPHRRNFWGTWQDEWQHREGDDSAHQAPHPPTPPPPPPRPSPEMVKAWRSYFHQFTGEWPEQHWAFGGRRFTPWHKGDVSFNPFVANLFSQGGGLLPLLVLQLLAEKPRYGNEIMSLLAEGTSGQWAANPGAIYPLMTELENRALIHGEWEDDRKRTIRKYELTERGHSELKRVTAIIRPKLEEAIDVLQSIVNNLPDDQAENDQSTNPDGE